MHVYTWKHIQTHAYIHMYTYTCTPTYLPTYLPTHTCTSASTSTSTSTSTCTHCVPCHAHGPVPVRTRTEQPSTLDCRSTSHLCPLVARLGAELGNRHEVGLDRSPLKVGQRVPVHGRRRVLFCGRHALGMAKPCHACTNASLTRISHASDAQKTCQISHSAHLR